LMLLLMTAIWLGGIAIAVVSAWLKGEDLSSLWIFGLLGLMGLFSLYQALWMLFGRMWIFFEPLRLRRCRKLFSWRRTEMVERSDVVELQIVSYQVKNGRRYTLRISRVEGNPLILLENETSVETCHWLGAQAAIWSPGLAPAMSSMRSVNHPVSGSISAAYTAGRRVPTRAATSR